MAAVVRRIGAFLDEQVLISITHDDTTRALARFTVQNTSARDVELTVFDPGGRSFTRVIAAGVTVNRNAPAGMLSRLDDDVNTFFFRFRAL